VREASVDERATRALEDAVPHRLLVGAPGAPVIDDVVVIPDAPGGPARLEAPHLGERPELAVARLVAGADLVDGGLTRRRARAT
jgi:hypothetical protein